MKKICSLLVLVVFMAMSFSPALAWNDGYRGNGGGHHNNGYRGGNNYNQQAYQNHDHHEYRGERHDYGQMTERDWVAVGLRVGLPLLNNIIMAPPRGYSSYPPGYYGNNPGVQGAYQQGLAERNYEAQREMERRAYEAGRGYGGYGGYRR